MMLLENKNLQWTHFAGGEQFGTPVGYWAAPLSIRDDGHVDVLYRWEPNTACHYHRHIAPISSLVLDGELHVVEYQNGIETGRRVRQAGDYAHKHGVEDHLEIGGPDGALVLFSLHAPDGCLTQQLSEKNSEVLRTITCDEVRAWSQRAA